jgi:hypothetical protein
MKECDNSKIHISSNFILSVCLLIMLDTLLLRQSLHCNTSPHFTQLHYTDRHLTSSHLHFTTLSFVLTHMRFLSFYFTSHHQTRRSTVHISKLISKLMNPFTALKKHLQTYFQTNEPLHCPKEPLTISLHFTFFIFSHILSTIHFTFYYFFHLSYQPFTSLHFAIHIYDSLPFTFLPFPYKHWKQTIHLQVLYSGIIILWWNGN